MGPETIATVLVVGVIVAAIAVYLIGITYNLRKASISLRGVHRGLSAIRTQTEPVGGVLGEVALDTAAMAGALTALVGGPLDAAGAEPLSMQDAVANAQLSGPARQPVAPREAPMSMREAVVKAKAEGEDDEGNKRRRRRGAPAIGIDLSQPDAVLDERPAAEGRVEVAGSVR